MSVNRIVERIRSPLPDDGPGERAHARPVDGDPGVVADDPCVVARRDLVGLVGADLIARTVLERDVRGPLERVALVVVLAQPRPGDQADALRPLPAGLEDLPADDGVADLVDLDAPERELRTSAGDSSRRCWGRTMRRIIAPSPRSARGSARSPLDSADAHRPRPSPPRRRRHAVAPGGGPGPGDAPARWLDLEVARRRAVHADPRLEHNAVLFRQPITTLDAHLARGLRVDALR